MLYDLYVNKRDFLEQLIRAFFLDVQGDLFVNQGDNVLLPPETEGNPPEIAHICYMFEAADKTKMCHAHIYCRSSDTILEDKSDPNELFVVDNCENVPLDRIVGKVKVDRKNCDQHWQEMGGLTRIELKNHEHGENRYFFSKRYIYLESRFVDFIQEPKAPCMSCWWQKKEERFQAATYHFYAEELGGSFIKWHNEKFCEGTGVLIDYERETVKKKKRPDCEQKDSSNEEIVQTLTVNTEEFPEKYRSRNRTVDIENPCQPLTVGVIENIQKNGIIKIREFYRVEDTGKMEYGHPHLVYQTNKIYTIDSMKKWQDVVKGKCYVRNKANIENVEHWVEEGPFRFFYDTCYNPDNQKFSKAPSQPNSNQRKRNWKNSNYMVEEAPLYKEIKTKLRSFDIYAGCGGLSEGLERAGLVDTKWAIEKISTTAEAFKLNHPGALVLTEDCNFILYELLNDRGQEYGLPKKGEVDILVGGPPCQGFSVINRFKSSKSALSNNAQTKTYLGFVDYYRPKYFLFENVRNFAVHEQSKFLQLTLKCLLEIGYQVTFGVLNAGKYGLPQSRRRFFLLGAAPGLDLPLLPKPTHCFGSFKEELDSIKVNSLLYDLGEPNCGKFGSLPYRRVTVKDAIEDLPSISFDSMSDEMPYTTKEANVAHYARVLRKYPNRIDIVTHHRCNKPSAIARKRMELIPIGGDWTDLPNTAVTLEDGNTTEVLRYSFGTNRQKKSDPPRGICGECARKKANEKCTNKCQCQNSIIPWSVAHTADRNNGWRGVYGRNVWNGHFSTITTNVDPTSSSGRVLHPVQKRTLTVRECARGQGFHDEYILTGSLQDMYDQIGNSVPPILATAIGREIINCLSKS